jgi:hypothetical protein
VRGPAGYAAARPQWPPIVGNVGKMYRDVYIIYCGKMYRGCRRFPRRGTNRGCKHVGVLFRLQESQRFPRRSVVLCYTEITLECETVGHKGASRLRNGAATVAAYRRQCW